MINNYTISSTEKFQISDINFNKDGLVPVISQCVHTGVILMMAWMNKEALKKTIDTNDMYYFPVRGKSFGKKVKLVGIFKNFMS